MQPQLTSCTFPARAQSYPNRSAKENVHRFSPIPFVNCTTMQILQSTAHSQHVPISSVLAQLVKKRATTHPRLQKNGEKDTPEYIALSNAAWNDEDHYHNDGI
eukprot:IDg22185t1